MDRKVREYAYAWKPFKSWESSFPNSKDRGYSANQEAAQG